MPAEYGEFLQDDRMELGWVLIQENRLPLLVLKTAALAIERN
jgi:hypothetical protein